MSSRRAFLIWISLHIKSKRSFRIALPIPLLLLLGASNILEDVSYFILNASRDERGRKNTSGSAKQIVLTCADFLREIALQSEPSDLIDIDVLDGEKRFALKFLLR